MMSVPAVQAKLAGNAVAAMRRGQGLVLALERDRAVREEFALSGAAVLRWEEHVPWIVERHGLRGPRQALGENQVLTRC